MPFVPENGDYNASLRYGLSHPHRENIIPNVPVDHLLFWSLIFAIQKRGFKEIGGFDESFTGYGAEDTDFAMTFNGKNYRLIFVEDYALHQYHKKYDPPINYFQSVVENANRYAKKWESLPMRNWLRAFEKMKLIEIKENLNIIVTRNPSEKEIHDCYSTKPF